MFLAIEVETNDQPPADVRARLSRAKNRVGSDIWRAAKAATEQAISVAWPETYFDNWPERGQTAEVVSVRQHTRRSD